MLLLLTGIALADSPLTSTEFHTAYSDHPMVQAAADSGELDAPIARFLSRGKRGLDLKAAVVNALSWDIEGKDNAARYLTFLAKAHKVPADELRADPTRLKPHEAFAYGYMLALDDYFDPSDAVPALAYARDELDNSRTVALIAGLVDAQLAMGESWCEVWRAVEPVLQDEDLRPDLKFEAETLIRDYLELYTDACPTCGELVDVQVPPEGHITRVDLARAWEREHPSVCACVDALPEGQSMPRMMFAFEIDREGAVSEVGYAGPPEGPDLCLQRALRTWRFMPWQAPEDAPSAAGEAHDWPTSWGVALEVAEVEPEPPEARE